MEGKGAVLRLSNDCHVKPYKVSEAVVAEATLKTVCPAGVASLRRTIYATRDASFPLSPTVTLNRIFYHHFSTRILRESRKTCQIQRD